MVTRPSHGFLLRHFIGLLVLSSTYSSIVLAQVPVESRIFGRNTGLDSVGMSVQRQPNGDENLYEWCSEWLNKSSEATKPEYGNVKAFCDRILISDNDADRFQAQQYLGALYREMRKLDTVVANIIMRLSYGNDTKKAYLLDEKYKIPMYMGMCYWTLHEGFKKFCIDPESNKYVRNFRQIFAHACQADWLTVKTILECFEDTCQDVKLFCDLPRPPAFLFDMNE